VTAARCDTESAPVADEPSDPNGLPVAGRYRAVRPYARGGLGEVLLAEDGELNRTVALKRIRERRADDPESRRRFLREAEVTARLQHPGIVPVYGLTHDEHGRPCYAMRLIEGESLQDAIQRLHGDQGARSPDSHSLEFRQLLRRFIDICNAVAYAHSRGVLHRDLKPANVMLGRYGETLLVDWGLAKPFERSDEHRAGGEETLAPESGNDGSATELGQAAGTPAYMSPEQAEGDWDAVGPAADVFGLGAILYSMLTGRPPYPGRTPIALDKAKRWDFPPPRPAPAALAAICLKAMAKDSEARYPNAQALAADVERWLADEPVSVYREAWRERAWRWVRRHRTSVAVAAAVLVVLTATAVGAAIISDRHRGEMDQERAEAEEYFRLAVDTNIAVGTLAEELKPIATINRQGLERILQQAEAGFEQLLTRVRQSDAAREGKARVLNALADVYLELGDVVSAEGRSRQALAIAEELVAAAPQDDGRQELLATGRERLAEARFDTGDSGAAVDLLRRAVEIRSRLAQRDRNNAGRQAALAWDWSRLGNFAAARRESAARAEAVEAALALRRRLSEQAGARPKDRADFARTLLDAADIAGARGDEPTARDYVANATDLAERLVREDPGHSDWSKLLADALMATGYQAQQAGRADEARDRFLRSREICEAFAQLDPGNTKWAQGRLYALISAENLVPRGRRSEPTDSIRRLEELAALTERLAARCPTNTAYRQLVAGTRWQIGMQYSFAAKSGPADQKAANSARAVELLHDTRQRFDDLSRLDPDRGAWVGIYRSVSDQLAMALRQRGQIAEADRVRTDALRRWAEFCDRRLARAPADAEHRQELGYALAEQANALVLAERYAEAQQVLTRAVGLLDAAVADVPSRADWAQQAAVTHGMLALTLRQLGDPTGHLAERKKEYAHYQRLTHLHPKDAERRRAMLQAADSVRYAHAELGQTAEADAVFREVRGPWGRSLADLARTVANARAERVTKSGAVIDAGYRPTRLEQLRSAVGDAGELYTGDPSPVRTLQLAEACLKLAAELNPAVPDEAAEARRLLTRVRAALEPLRQKGGLTSEEEDLLAACAAAEQALPPAAQ
jgi:tRNA A-37 threonylcarbamoyl transferase component Bud32